MTVMDHLRRSALPRTAHDGDLAVVNSIEAFVFAVEHPMRGALCVFCHLPVGTQKVAVIGLAALADDACDCGAISSDLFLIHAHHFPADPKQIEAVLRRAMSCQLRHPAHY